MRFLITLISLLIAPAALCGLSFERLDLYHKAQPDDQLAIIEVKFKNEGAKALKIEKIRTGCSCMSGETDKARYAPGESGSLRLTYKLGTLKGKAEKTAHVHTSDGKQQALKVTVEVPELFSITPRTLKWKAGEAPEPRKFRLTVADGNPIHVTRMVPTSEDFELQLKVLEKGRSYEIVATPKSTAAPSFTMVRVETDSGVKRFQINQVFLVVNRAP